MRKLILDILVVNMMLGVAALAFPSPSNAQLLISEIIDSTGDGAGNTLDMPQDVAADSNGNVFVAGYSVFKITPGGAITEIIDATGDGAGNVLNLAAAVAVDSSGNVLVAGYSYDNAFRITTPGTCSTGGTPCAITEIIDATGDGGGNTLGCPYGVAVDGSGNVFVGGVQSDNAFRITTPGTCSTGGTPCAITEIIDATGDGAGNTLTEARRVDVDSSGNFYIHGVQSWNAFKVTPGGTITEIIDTTGDGQGNPLYTTTSIAVDSAGSAYVTGGTTDNAFKIQPVLPPVPALSNPGLMLLGASLLCVVLWVARRQRMANA